jgi:RNA polymerase sigma-70 factor (family 1)
MSSCTTDLQLLQDIRQSNTAAFEELFKKYYMPLTRFAWRYVNCKAIAEEMVQELFADLWEERITWEVEGSLRAYLYSSIRNRSLNHLKHQKVKQKYDPLWMEEKENPTIKFEDHRREEEIREAIKNAIEELPPRSKMTYKLNRYDGLTYQEIAEVMDVSIKTVESQMTRTLKILRGKLSYLLVFSIGLIL